MTEIKWNIATRPSQLSAQAHCPHFLLCFVFQLTYVPGLFPPSCLQRRKVLAGVGTEGAGGGRGSVCKVLLDQSGAVVGSPCRGLGSLRQPLPTAWVLVGFQPWLPPCVPAGSGSSSVCTTGLHHLLLSLPSAPWLTGYLLHYFHSRLLNFLSVSCLTLTDTLIYKHKSPWIKVCIPQEMHESLRIQISGKNACCLFGGHVFAALPFL